MSQIYKRLDPDKPAYTITGSGGGGTHVYHWKENRALTNRERARLQSFPDDFAFCGSKESVRRQIGMAVPPLGAKAIIEAILKTFAGMAYNSIEPKWKEDVESESRRQLRLLESSKMIHANQNGGVHVQYSPRNANGRNRKKGARSKA